MTCKGHTSRTERCWDFILLSEPNHFQHGRKQQYEYPSILDHAFAYSWSIKRGDYYYFDSQSCKQIQRNRMCLDTKGKTTEQVV